MLGQSFSDMFMIALMILAGALLPLHHPTTSSSGSSLREISCRISAATQPLSMLWQSTLTVFLHLGVRVDLDLTLLLPLPLV